MDAYGKKRREERCERKGLLSRVADPENFHQIRIRILSVLWLCKVKLTRKKYLKNRAFTHIFQFFQAKKIIIQLSEEIRLM